MATLDQLHTALINADKAGDVSAAQMLAGEIKRMRGSVKTEAPLDPTEGMGTFDRAAAGFGSNLAEKWMGMKQRFGQASQEEVDYQRKLNAPLANTTAGKAGNILGDVALGAGAMVAAPATAGYAGAAGLGGLFGFLRPTAENESAVKNTVLGTGEGLLGQAAGQLAGKGIRAAKAAVEPFYAKGQDAILGRLLQKSAGGGQFAQDAITNLRNAKELVPGSLPTAGQAANNPGIAALERTATATQPEVAAEMAQRFANQNQARGAVLGQLADPAKREFFDQSRQTAAKELYEAAFAQTPDTTPWLKGQFSNLKMRPAFKSAIQEAQERAMNEGIKLDPKNTTQVAHYAKMALDDMIGKAKASGGDAQGLISTRDKLVMVMESKDFAPAYREARSTYAAMSKPINEIDTVAAVQKAATNPLTEQLQPQAFARAMSDQTAQRATGFRGATMENTLSPEAMQQLQAIQADLARSQFAQNAGRGPGSDTIQKLAYSNMIDAAGIPSFLRNLGVGQIAGNLATRGADAIYGRASKEMSTKLAQSMLNPQEVARLLQSGAISFPQYLALQKAGGLLGVTAGGQGMGAGLLVQPE